MPALSGGAHDDTANQDKFIDIILKGMDRDVAAHPQTVLCVLAALCGFSAQMSLRETFLQTKNVRIWDVFKQVQTENGAVYFESEQVLVPLLRIKEWNTSLLRIMQETARDFGAMEFPNVQDMLFHVQDSYGAEVYGVPRVDKSHQPKFSSADMLRDCWDPICLYLKMFDGGRPHIWPHKIAQTAQRYLKRVEGRIDPSVIVPIAIETAISMSRIDPKYVVGMAYNTGPKIIDVTKSDFGALLMSDDFGVAIQNARAA